MFPWLLLPQSAIGVLPTHPDLTYLPLETCRMLWLVFISAIAILSVVIRMASRTGPRTGDVNEGSEMEKGSIKEAKEEEMIFRRRSGSVGVWRVE